MNKIWNLFPLLALCHGNTDNIVLLDWGKYAEDIYPFSFAKGEKVGVLFARSLQLLKDAGLDTENIYIVGHSLGSHIAGFAGKCNNFTIPRITGMWSHFRYKHYFHGEMHI